MMTQEDINLRDYTESLDDDVLLKYKPDIYITDKTSHVVDGRYKTDRYIGQRYKAGECYQYKTDSFNPNLDCFHLRIYELEALQNGFHMARYQLHFMYLNLKYEELKNKKAEELIPYSIMRVNLDYIRNIIDKIEYKAGNIEPQEGIKGTDWQWEKTNMDWYVRKLKEDKYLFRIQHPEEGKSAFIYIPFNLIDGMCDKWL